MLYQFTSSIRPLSVSKLVHQDIDAHDGLSKIYGDSSANLLRQHPPDRAAEDTEIVIRVLEYSGFMIKKRKSILKPTQIIPFLHFIVNSL